MGFRGVREASGFSRAQPVPQPSRTLENGGNGYHLK